MAMANCFDAFFHEPPPMKVADCKCAQCLFGVLAPDRYNAKRGRAKRGKDTETPQPVHHCTINPPAYPSGHPVVEGTAVCALFTTRENEPRQPLRSLTFPNGTAGFTVTMKG